MAIGLRAHGLVGHGDVGPFAQTLMWAILFCPVVRWAPTELWLKYACALRLLTDYQEAMTEYQEADTEYQEAITEYQEAIAEYQEAICKKINEVFNS